MDRGLAAPEVIVIHRRKIVMYQRVAMNQLHRRGNAQRGRSANREECGALYDEKGAEPLAAAQCGVPHRVEQAGLMTAIRRKYLFKNFLDIPRGVPQRFFERQRRGFSQYPQAPLSRHLCS